MIFTLLLATSHPIDLSCNARDNSARILRSASPADVHPDWSGDSVIGTGQGVRANAWLADTFGNVYLRGDLYSTRGGLLNRDVFILQREWNCTSPPVTKQGD